MSIPTSPARRLQAKNDCRLFDRHQWHPTFTVGEYLCTICGAKYYCPLCTMCIPAGARARFCPEHAAEQEARDQAAHAARMQQQQKGTPS
jgi:hypothetical protein